MWVRMHLYINFSSTQFYITKVKLSKDNAGRFESISVDLYYDTVFQILIRLKKKFFFFYFFIFPVLGIKLRALYMIGKDFITELHPQPTFSF
jgi:hypothetical protein